MKPEDFKNKEPRQIIEEYLSGNVKAWGILQNRSGKVTRQFSADLNGTWDGKQLISMIGCLIDIKTNKILFKNIFFQVVFYQIKIALIVMFLTTV